MSPSDNRIGPGTALARLGEGMGEVCKAEDTRLKRLAATRISAPAMMVSGREDFVHPLETAQKPLFRLLPGSPPGAKEHVRFDGGHYAPLQGTMRESLDWFDRYPGPVERQGRRAARHSPQGQIDRK
jgi:pimeloyl-ACP methyl ester carboxylesterase